MELGRERGKVWDDQREQKGDPEWLGRRRKRLRDKTRWVAHLAIEFDPFGNRAI